MTTILHINASARGERRRLSNHFVTTWKARQPDAVRFTDTGKLFRVRGFRLSPAEGA